MQFIQIKYPETALLQQFINEAGSSLTSFRYFQKRPLSVIQNHLCTFLLINDHKPVAYGHLDKEAETIWLGIAVSEAYKGKGLGLQMMNQLIGYAKQHNFKQIKLSVDNDNYSAVALYKKLGFVLSEQKETFSFYILNFS